MKKFLKSMPKVELHAHLNGSLNIESIRELGERLYGANTEEFIKLCQQFIHFDSNATLSDCFQKFKFMHELTATRKGLALATQMVIRDFSKDNVIYLDLRTTPKANDHMTRSDYMDCVLTAIESAQHTYPEIKVKLLPSIDRSQPLSVAENITELALKYQKLKPSLLKGLDFSGNPTVGSFSDFADVLLKARNGGLQLTLHCAEVHNEKEIAEMITFGMSRCGHGTFLSDAQIDELQSKSIAIECCLTSNVKTATVSNFDDHHLKRILEKGSPTVICTDDSGVFNTTLSMEFEIAAETFNLNRTQCIDLTLTAVEHSFATETEKNELKAKINKFRKENLC